MFQAIMDESQNTSRSILFITPQPFLQWRGSPIRVKFDVEALAESGYKVDLLAFPVGEDPHIHNVNVIRIPNPFGISNVPVGPSFVKALLDVFLLFKALQLSYKSHYDIVHCVEEASLIGVLLKWLRGYKLVYEKHSHISSYKRGPLRNTVLGVYRFLENLVIRRADLTFAGPGVIKEVVSIHEKGCTQVMYSIPSSRISSTEQKAKEIRHQLGLADNDLLITYVGTFAQYQGIDLLLSAIPVVIKENDNAQFLIIGGSPEEIEQCKGLLERHDVLEHVSFLGIINPDQTAHYLFASDILLSPRIAGKTNPIKIFDYLKANRPIVATNHISNSRILDDSMSELTEIEAEAFARGILDLMDNADRRVQLARQGKKLIDEKYNYDEFKQWIKSGYDRMLEGDC
jgi:glycosyltransferase involved in cell wall biosynthesis